MSITIINDPQCRHTKLGPAAHVDASATGSTARGNTCSNARISAFVRDVDRGACHVAQTHAIAADEVTEGFAQSLKRDQGLAVVTVESYARWTRKFLVWRFGQGEVCLRDVRVTDASAFVKSEAKRMAPAALKNVG